MERLVVWHRWIVPAREAEGEAVAIEAFTRSVAARLRAAGGIVVAQVSGTVVAALDPADLADVVELALELLEEADTAGPLGAPLPVAFAIAFGEVTMPDTVAGAPLRGSPVDRAQQIANRARGGELVLDASARELAAYEYLFARNVGGGSGAPRGQALDRLHPKRDECRAALARLGSPPIAPCAADALASLRAAASSSGPVRIAVRGPFGAGATTLLAAVESTQAPSLVLHVGATPGGLEPLGSLRLALQRHELGVATLRERVRKTAGDDAGEDFDAVVAGRGIARADAVATLGALLEAYGDGSGRPWIVIDPALGADPATIEIVAEAQLAARAPTLVLARLPVDAAVPASLARPLVVHEVTIPPLHTADALVIARGVLRQDTDEDIVRRVAVLGGDSPLGVVEAARVLVASGELVPKGDGFAWRTTPRNVAGAAPVDAIVLERLRGLDPIAQQVLEIACVVAEGAPATLVENIAAREGLAAADCARVLAQLAADGLVRALGRPTPAGNVLRSAVLRAMPSARAVDLHRAVADALSGAGDVRHQGFAAATLAHYLAEGGLAAEAAEAILAAARAAAASGFVRSAMRLAAGAVRLDPSEATRNAAAAVTHTASTRPPPSETASIDVRLPPPPAAPGGFEGLAQQERLRRAAEAIRARDLDGAELLLDGMGTSAGAAGSAAASRLRAVVRLANGDAASALFELARARASGDADPRETARVSIALGVALLRTGDTAGAVRAALGALATSRTIGDERGEQAALLTLAACFRAAGRPEDATRLQAAAGT